MKIASEPLLHAILQSCQNRPVEALITPANVNDTGFGRALELKQGVVYVFDKAYCHFGWWLNIHQAGSVFVTRPKTNASWKTLSNRDIAQTNGDGFTISTDRQVRLASKSDNRLPMALRLQIARQNSADHIPPKRLRELVSAFIHSKRKIQTIEKPPPSRAIQKPKPNMQLQLC